MEPPSLLADALVRYQEVYLRARNLAPRTRAEYVRDLADFAAFLAGRSRLIHVPVLQRTHVEAYLAELDRNGYSGACRRRRLAAIRSFCRFLVMDGLIALDPTTGLSTPGREHHTPRVLSEAEYRRLLAVCAQDPRLESMITLFLQTGMRLSELAGLCLNDLLLEEGDARGAVRLRGKGRKERTVTLNAPAVIALRRYLALRPATLTDHLFPGVVGHLRPRTVQIMVRSALASAGIQGASVHTLRHTFATHHVRRGTSLSVVQAALGHSSLTTTSLYVHLARDVMDRELEEHAL